MTTPKDDSFLEGLKTRPEPLTHEWVMEAYYEYTRRLFAYDNRHKDSDLQKLMDEHKRTAP